MPLLSPLVNAVAIPWFSWLLVPLALLGLLLPWQAPLMWMAALAEYTLRALMWLGEYAPVYAPAQPPWPVLLLTLAQKLGSAFEGILVSVNSSQELAVMGICGPYITIITTVSYGLGIAANAATGRAYADRSWEASHKACVRAFLLHN